MGAPQFTPSSAPWRVEKAEFGYEVVGGSEKMRVLVAEHLSERAARLIAAAPELYDALDAFLQMFLGADERETVEQYNARADAAIETAQSALAKARGEQ